MPNFLEFGLYSHTIPAVTTRPGIYLSSISQDILDSRVADVASRRSAECAGRAPAGRRPPAAARRPLSPKSVTRPSAPPP
ncbi:hypothetical protein EVAR_99492_1 [Eumeta japonica]|uniref:Uncharacterized protein n=1 Tax=Eumeta variegata TaxID=151549 RepID=A0A4C1Z5A1_EUMVA|nr:hypothetical protein EVAR_99492_1 [Eumeta japonica]